ncbi:MAG: endonuclease [Saprospiraceae bacterium]
MKQNQYLKICLLLLGSFLSINCQQQKVAKTDPISKKEGLRVAFYNVENFMDTINDPLTRDEEFTPKSDKQWNTEKYFSKVGHINQVIDSLGFPAIMGFAEIEHGANLEDLCASKRMQEKKYKWVSQESPDERGIDVGLIYRSDIVQMIDFKAIPVVIPDNVAIKGDSSTRDILYFRCMINNRDTLYVFVNHWPSRSGGELQSDPLRQFAAMILKQRLRPLISKSPNALILVIGDFNDTPTNNSISEILGAQSISSKEALMINPGLDLKGDWTGSHCFRGQWNLLDQIIYARGFVSSSSPFLTPEFNIYHPRFILFKDPKTQKLQPNRTYGGNLYYGGYSDHLPVYLDLRLKK